MQISPIGPNYSQKQTNFKSAYPVYHWVAETNGSYALATTEELNRTLQRRLVSMVNGTGSKAPARLDIMKRITNYLKYYDRVLNSTPVARTFYNPNGGMNKNGFETINYMITGPHALEFDEQYGKPLGKIKAKVKEYHGIPAAELNIARTDYQKRGMNYVKKLVKNFQNENGDKLGLHVKFEIERSRTGKIKDYKIIDLRFLPEEGRENPFEKLKIKKNRTE